MEAEIRQRIEKLERFAADIVSCRVTGHGEPANPMTGSTRLNARSTLVKSGDVILHLSASCFGTFRSLAPAWYPVLRGLPSATVSRADTSRLDSAAEIALHAFGTRAKCAVRQDTNAAAEWRETGDLGRQRCDLRYAYGLVSAPGEGSCVSC